MVAVCAGHLTSGWGVPKPDSGWAGRTAILSRVRTESKSLVAAALHLSTNTVNTPSAEVRTKCAAIGRPAPTKAALVARALQDSLSNIDEL